MTFRHVLITRFNLPTVGREVAFRTESGWLEQRLDLFERICLPSVAAQSEQRFDWILYFDEQSPRWLRDELAQMARVRPFHPCYTALFDSSGWARTVREVIGGPVAGRAIGTSNLDNDDAIASDYIARVRQAALEGWQGERFAVNVPDGYVLSGERLFLHRHTRNAFTNMIEPDSAALATTMTIRHMELADHVRVVQAEGPPAWVQLIHERNVSNRVRGRQVAAPVGDERFAPALFARVRAPSPVSALFERALIAPLRGARDAVFAVIRKIIRVDPL